MGNSSNSKSTCIANTVTATKNEKKKSNKIKKIKKKWKEKKNDQFMHDFLVGNIGIVSC